MRKLFSFRFGSFLLAMFVTMFFLACESTMENNQQQSVEPVFKPLQSAEHLLAGQAKAICYSGYRSGQHPDRGEGAVNPTYEQILEDLLILQKQTPFRLMRLYDCGTNTQMVLEVIKDHQLNFEVMLGIWLRAELSAHETCEWLTEPIPQEELDANKIKNAEEIAQGIALANQYSDIIVAVNVGNEALVEWNDHMVDVDTIIGYVKQVQQAIDQPVTVADNYKWWADHGKELAAVVDFVSIHTYPIWENKDIEEGMSYTIENVLEVMDSLPGAPIVITEAGWATTASEFGQRASEEKQKMYVDALLYWAERNNISTFIFEAFDEDWKGNPNDPLGAEKHWGLYKVDRSPKLTVGLWKNHVYE